MPKETLCLVSCTTKRYVRILVHLRWGVLLFVLTSGLSLVTPAWAAVELVSLEVTSLTDRVRIEWETAREYNVSAFQLFYKQETEPDSAYQPIGQPINAQGELESGAIYTAEFFQLEPSTSYCFRLEEITTNDEPGDRFERCGYGIGTTPTATFTLTPTSTPIPSNTPIPLDTPTFTAVPTSPLATPTPTPAQPLPDGSITEGGVVVVVQSPSPSPVFTGTVEMTATLAVAVETPVAPPTYLVQTATPTPAPLLTPPTPTPLPVATPTPVLGMIGFGRWLAGSGNMAATLNEVLVLLLCLGGIGLALLGVMTLLGAMFYLRSRM